MSDVEPPSGEVAGERDTHSVTRSLSMQSRVSNILAVGLMSVLGLGSLTWYYTNALMRQRQTQRETTAASVSRAQGDLPLPGLGRIDPPAPFIPRTLPEIPLAVNTPARDSAAVDTVAVNSVAAPKTPSQVASERQLSGAVFSPQSVTTPALDAGGGVAGAGQAAGPGAPGGTGSVGELGTLLRPTMTSAVRARVLPAQRLLLPKGAFIDCTLETAIDSTLPGMTTCVMATDAFGVDGNVVLLERGTKLIGETRGEVQQGAARIFVLWTEARSPSGVIVPLDSPGADELGRSGLPGEVNRHFWQRFGAAMLVSVIDGVVQAAVQSSRSGGGNVILNPSSSQDVLTEILKNTINVPPTVVKRNGDRIQVLVARDVDFRSVYELR